MCGRYALDAPPELIASYFGLHEPPAMAPRYNIAPSQPAPVIRSEAQARRLGLLRWGLIPPWAKDAKIGNRMINARAESAATKPAFRHALRSRRCLVPATSFYEWRRMDGRKQPYFIRRADGLPLAMAGLWEEWLSPQGERIESFTILTTDAAEPVARLHARMPLILPHEAFALWLDPAIQEVKKIQALLRPALSEGITLYPVSPLVNNPRNDSAACIQPAENPAS